MTFANGTHVAFDSATAERLTRLGAGRVVRDVDNLLVGPCRLDAEEHGRARAAWWGAPEPWASVASPDVAWTPPVVLWTSSSIRDRVSLWRACWSLDNIGMGRRDVLPVSVPVEGAAGFRCDVSVANASDDALTNMLAAARPWPRLRYEAAARLWTLYAGADVGLFLRACRRGRTGFPELAALRDYLAGFFPRQSADGLRLSTFDACLLGALSSAWQTPVKIFVGSEPLQQRLVCTGDLFLPRRLEHWARHAGSAVESASTATPDHPMGAATYRLTARGARLLDRLDRIEDAPLLPVAGVTAYEPGGWTAPS